MTSIIKAVRKSSESASGMQKVESAVHRIL